MGGLRAGLALLVLSWGTADASPDWDKAIRDLDMLVRTAPADVESRAEALAQEMGSNLTPSREARVLQARALALVRTEGRQKAAQLLDRAEGLARGRDPEALGMVLYVRTVLAGDQGNLDEALRIGTESVKILEACGSAALSARSLAYLGSIERRRGNTDVAIDLLTRAAHRAEENNAPLYAAIAFNNLGAVYRVGRRWPEALQLHQRAAELFRSIGDQANVGSALSNVAGTRIDMGDFAGSVEAFTEAEKVLSENKMLTPLVSLLVNKAAALNSLQRHQEAYESVERARRLIAEKGAMRVEEPLVWEGRGWSLIKLGQREAGLQDLERGLAGARASGDARHLRNVLLTLAEARAGGGEFEKAFAHQKEAYEINQKLQADQARERMDAFGKRLQDERQRREVEKLEQVTAEQRARLERQNSRNRWLLTLWGATGGGLGLVGVFLLQLRRKNRELAASNRQLAETSQALKATQDKLYEAARYAGMAQVATGVLHHIGNLLNSLNVGVEFAQEQARRMNVAGVGKLAKLLAQDRTDATDANGDRSRKIRDYVGVLAAQLEQEQETLRQELSNVRQHCDRVKDAVQMESRQTFIKAAIETVRPRELVEAAVRLHQAALDQAGIRLHQEVSELGPIQVDRFKVSLIFTHLLQNAIESLECVPPDRRTLTLKAEASPRRGYMTFSVIDTGIGIEPERLAAIFAVGSSSKTGRYGYGLHSSANSATEMSGRLMAESEGVGKGARLILELPLGSAASGG